jgi:hypothetical protein
MLIRKRDINWGEGLKRVDRDIGRGGETHRSSRIAFLAFGVRAREAHIQTRKLGREGRPARNAGMLRGGGSGIACV